MRCLQWLGYDPAAVSRMPLRLVHWLTLAGVCWCAGAFAVSFSGAYLAYLGAEYHSLWWGTVPVIAGLAIFIFTLNLHRMFVTSGGYGYHWDVSRLAVWRPDPLRIGCVVFLSFLLSQPLVLFMNRGALDEILDARATAKAALYRNSRVTEFGQRRKHLLQKKAILDEQSEMLGLLRPSDGRRKALLIGMQHYRHLDAVPNSAHDVTAIEKILRREGYAVSVSIDGEYDDVLLLIDRYVKQLNPGDISIVYYSGYGFQRGGRNYIAPIGFQPQTNMEAINVNQLLEAIDASAPQFSLVLLDASRRMGASDTTDRGGMASLTPGLNSVIVMAARLGRAVIERPGATRDELSAALLRHIGAQKGIDEVLQAVGADVAEATRDATDGPQVLAVRTSLSRYAQIARPSGVTEISKMVQENFARSPCINGQRQLATGDVGKCLAIQRQLVERQLQDINEQSGALLERKVHTFESRLRGASMLRERWLAQWATPWQSISLTLAIVLVMTAGDVLRDIRPAALREYERERIELGRRLIEQRYAADKLLVDAELANFRAVAPPGLRWHERISYFEPPLQTMAGRALSESNGSVVDLLAVLTDRAVDGGGVQ